MNHGCLFDSAESATVSLGLCCKRECHGNTGRTVFRLDEIPNWYAPMMTPFRNALAIFLLATLTACSQVESPDSENAVAPAVPVAVGEDCPDLSGTFGLSGGGREWFLQDLPGNHDPQVIELTLNEAKSQYRLRTMVTESVLRQWAEATRAQNPEQYDRWLALMARREALRKQGELVDAVEQDMATIGLVPDHWRYEPRRRCEAYWAVLGDVPNSWYPNAREGRFETELWAGRADNGDLLLRFDRYELMDGWILGRELRGERSQYYLRWPKVQGQGVAWEMGPALLPKPKPKINLDQRVDALVRLNTEILEQMSDGMALTLFEPTDDGGKALRESAIVALTIRGQSPSNARVSDFLRWLTESGHFDQVDLVSIRQADGRIEFDILAKWKAPMPEDEPS